MYFKTKNKEVVDTINSVVASHKQFIEGFLEISKKVGGSHTEAFIKGFTFYGFVFDDISKVPKKFKKSQHCKGYVPYKGHELWSEINSLQRLKEENAVADSIGFRQQLVGRNYYLQPTAKTFGDYAYFQVHDDCVFEPPAHFELITKKEWDDAK